jgi:xanthine dehydrogenase accessory factor
MSPDLTREIAALCGDDTDAALCLVVRTEGSTPAKPGAAMVVRADGTSSGTIGGGALERAVIEEALAAIAEERCSLTEHRLVRDHAMCCGGTVETFIRPMPVADRLYIFGAGHVGRALATAASLLAFDVTVVDERPGIFDEWDAGGMRLLAAAPAAAVEELRWNRRTHVVIATHSHSLDREVLARTLERTHAYCGMIGSRRKVAITRRLFLEQRWASAEQLARVDMPIGLDIGASTPGEIAISIAARLVALRRGAPPVPSSIISTTTEPSDDHECLPAVVRRA